MARKCKLYFCLHRKAGHRQENRKAGKAGLLRVVLSGLLAVDSTKGEKPLHWIGSKYVGCRNGSIQSQGIF